MQSETLMEEFSRLVREYKQEDGPGGIEAWNLIADFAVDNAEAIEAALSAAEPVSSRNDEAGYVEFLNDDVPYMVRDIQGAVAILLDLETRNVIGYRVYDPDSVFARQPAPSVEDHAKLLSQVASIICEETCGLTSQCKSREAAKALYEKGYLTALSAQVQDARSDDDEEIYEIGVRDGYERAVQEIDMKTGGDGEYRYCTDHDPERHTPGPAEMIQRIVDRFETLNLIDDAEERGDFWDAPGSAQVQDVAGWPRYSIRFEGSGKDAHLSGMQAWGEVWSVIEWTSQESVDNADGLWIGFFISESAANLARDILPAAPAKQEG